MPFSTTLGDACALEGFAYVEDETRLSALAETVVETHVDVLLELPAVAYAEVGKQPVGA